MSLEIRDVEPADLGYFFRFQQDPEANHMAAFTSKDPSDRIAFDAHWERIRAEKTVLIRTVLCNGAVAGSVLSYVMDESPEVSYWLGREFWGQGVATEALLAFLQVQTARPIFARVAKDNLGSVRVLEKTGFIVIGEEKGFAEGRQAEVEEYVLRLDPN